jgi:hypothetical protein
MKLLLWLIDHRSDYPYSLALVWSEPLIILDLDLGNYSGYQWIAPWLPVYPCPRVMNGN